MRRDTPALRPRPSNAIISASICRPFPRRSRCRSIAVLLWRRFPTVACARRSRRSQPGMAGNSRTPGPSSSRQPCSSRSTEPRRRGEYSSCVLMKEAGLRRAEGKQQDAAQGVMLIASHNPKLKSCAWQHAARTATARNRRRDPRRLRAVRVS